MPSQYAPVCVELHDVAPATWRLCTRALAMVQSVGQIPVSLLVVPDYHRRGRVTDAAGFTSDIESLVSAGAEVALHGLYHLDEGPPARTVVQWLRRRVRTRSEGEFAALDATETSERIARALGVLGGTSWKLSGFVPPAWLLSREARVAAERFPFEYIALREMLIALPDHQAIATTTLSYAAFSYCRRALSRPVLSTQLWRAPRDRPLRLAIHPIDAGYENVLTHWRKILDLALVRREPLTVAATIARELRSRHPGQGPPAGTNP